MASILNKISFKNFFNYYGEFEENDYNLKKGLNIIVADNGAGKSKFFNAFLWIFQDQILDSDDKILKSIKDVYTKIVSDKAKYEVAVGSTVTCGVSIEFTSGNRKKYNITKSFMITKLDDDINSLSSWSYVPSELEINETELVLTKYKPVYDEDEKLRIIDKLIKPAFRKYSFLQGEEVDEIIDFTRKESIEEAVQKLTNISKYDKLVELTKDFANKSLKDLENRSKELNQFSKDLDNAISSKNLHEERLNQEQLKFDQYNDTFKKARAEKTELDKHYSNAEKRKELDDRLKKLNAQLRDKSGQLEDLLDRLNNRFFDGNFAWIAMGMGQVVEDFRKRKDSYTEKHFKKKTLKNIEDSPNDYFHFLPVDSPDSVSVKNMIDHEHCYVCDRPAKKGTQAFEYLVKLKDRRRAPADNLKYVKNNLREFFDNIQINAQPFYTRISQVRPSIISNKGKEVELNGQIDDLKAKIKSLKDQRGNILIAGLDDEVTDKDIISNYNAAVKRMENARTTLDDIISPKIRHVKSEIKKIESEIDNLSGAGDIPTGYKEHYAICKDLAMAAEYARENVFGEMVRLLEDHANTHFKNLIANNDLAGGILKFDKTASDTINLNYVDRKGNIVSGNSEGFQRMKKFAVVMAIITANNSEYNYPLLADAPISAFGSGFTEGFFEATSKVFPQSIILVKELYDKNDESKVNELGKKLIKDPNVSTFYVNHVPEGAEQIDLVTTKSKLK